MGHVGMCIKKLNQKISSRWGKNLCFEAWDIIAKRDRMITDMRSYQNAVPLQKVHPQMEKHMEATKTPPSLVDLPSLLATSQVAETNF